MEKADPTREILHQLLADLEDEVEMGRRIDEKQSFLVAADGRFLGRVARPEHSESLLNAVGRFGSGQSETSILNYHGPYGSSDSPLSARNPLSASPPLLFVHGEFWGLVSANPGLGLRVISPDRFWRALLSDWESFERGEFSDSGSIPIHAAP